MMARTKLRRTLADPALAAGLAVLLGIAGCRSEPPAEPVIYRDLGRAGVDLDPAAALGLVNDYRAKEGVGRLALDPALVAIAAEEAARLAARDSIRLSLAAEHRLEARLAAAGYESAGAVQNVSAGYRTLAEAFSGWRELTTHNANMLSPTANRFGIATAYAPNSKYKVYWVAVFADPTG